MLVVGISSCLAGQEVRYDGRHKYSTLCMEELSEHFALKAFCPEIAIGMGVPREPIRLVECGGLVRALGVKDTSIDVTDALKEYAQSLYDQLAMVSGYIFTQRSPSCGLFTAKLHSPRGDCVDVQSGLFAAEVQRMYPNLPVEEAERLELPHIRQRFIDRVRAYRFGTLL